MKNFVIGLDGHINSFAFYNYSKHIYNVLLTRSKG